MVSGLRCHQALRALQRFRQTANMGGRWRERERGQSRRTIDVYLLHSLLVCGAVVSDLAHTCEADHLPVCAGGSGAVGASVYGRDARMKVHYEVVSQLNPKYALTGHMCDYYGVYHVVKYDEHNNPEIIQTFTGLYRKDAYTLAGKLTQESYQTK